MKGLNVMEKSQLANWYAFSTKRSEEFRAARHLSEQSVTTFLPYQTTTVNHARKLTYRKKPLFPGYIFANVDLNEISITTLCSTRGVSGILCGDQSRPSPLRTDVIEALLLNCDNAGEQLPPSALAPGDTVRLTRGPLMDVVAKVEKVAAKDRIWLLLQGANIGTRVNVKREALERVK